MTNGRMHKCRHICCSPPINDGSSRACATEQRCNNNHQITCTGTLSLCKVNCSLLMYAEKQALYISPLVRPTFRTYVVKKFAMYPSNMASVTSAIELSAAVIYKGRKHRFKTIVTTDHRHRQKHTGKCHWKPTAPTNKNHPNHISNKVRYAMSEVE